METKYLWDRVDALRDALKDIKEENDDLIAENKHLKLRVEELDDYSDDVDVKRSRAEVENDKLKNGWYVTNLQAEIKSLNELITAKHIKRNEDSNLIASLKAEIKELKQCSNVAFVEVLNRSNDKLKAENDSLKDEAVKWNRKYNKVEYPKDYQKEAREYFNHNPKCKGVRFHMLDYDEYDYDDNVGLNGLSGEYNGSLMAEDCLVEIDNEVSTPTFH